MSFKEYLQELELAGVKSKGQAGSYGKSQDQPFDTRTQFVKNNKLHAKLRDGFSDYFGKLKGSTSNEKIAQYIDSLKLDTGKGASGLADFYIKLLSHILYDEQGNRYDLSSEKDMGTAKGALQKLGAIYPGVFFLGRSLLNGDDSHEDKDVKQILSSLMKMKTELYQAQKIPASATAGELYKSGKEGDAVLARMKGDNARLQDTFTDFFINANKGQTDGLNDIIGVPAEDWNRIVFQAPEGGEGDDFGQALLNVSKEVKNSKDKAGKEQTTKAKDQLMMNKAKEIFGGEEPADMKTAINFFDTINKYGGVDSFHSGIFGQGGNVPSLAINSIGADNFAKIIQKYKIPDMDPKAIKALGQSDAPDSDTAQLGDKQKQELQNAILNAKSAVELNRWAKANLDKTGIKIDNETMAMIDDAISKRFADKENTMAGVGRYPATPLTVKKLFQKYGGHSTVGESEEILGFREFLSEQTD